MLAQKYLSKAKRFLEQNLPEKALCSLNSALYADPFCAQSLRYKIDILKRHGEFQTAIDCLFSILKREPDHDYWSLELAEVYINYLHRPSEGLRWLERVFRSPSILEKDRQKGYRLKAEALIYQERYYEAWLVLKKAINLYPFDLKMLFLRGWCALQLERFYASATDFQKILQKEPIHSDANYYLGVAFEGMGETKLMRKQYMKTFKLDQSTLPCPIYDREHFCQIVHEGLKYTTPFFSFPVKVDVQFYPMESILDTFPYDPRQVGRFMGPKGKVGKYSERLFRIYQWNLERFCHTPYEIIEEVRFFLRHSFESQAFFS